MKKGAILLVSVAIGLASCSLNNRPVSYEKFEDKILQLDTKHYEKANVSIKQTIKYASGKAEITANGFYRYQSSGKYWALGDGSPTLLNSFFPSLPQMSLKEMKNTSQYDNLVKVSNNNAYVDYYINPIKISVKYNNPIAERQNLNYECTFDKYGWITKYTENYSDASGEINTVVSIKYSPS